MADISQSFQAISMKLYGHMRHGRRSSYNDVWHHMSWCHWIMTENDRKNVQMNVWIVKSQQEMKQIHSYHDTWKRFLKTFGYEFGRWPVT